MTQSYYFRFPGDLFEDDWFFQAFEDMNKLWNGVNIAFPPTDTLVNKTTGDLILKLAVAGYDSENISLTAEDGHIIVEGKAQTQNDEFKIVNKGIKGSAFKTKYPISSKFDLSKIKAVFKNGILTLTIPVAEEKKPRKVDIEL